MKLTHNCPGSHSSLLGWSLEISRAPFARLCDASRLSLYTGMSIGDFKSTCTSLRDGWKVMRRVNQNMKLKSFIWSFTVSFLYWLFDHFLPCLASFKLLGDITNAYIFNVLLLCIQLFAIIVHVWCVIALHLLISNNCAYLFSVFELSYNT